MKTLLIGRLVLGNFSAFPQDKTINISAKHLYKAELNKLSKLLSDKGYTLTTSSESDFTINADCKIVNGGALAYIGIPVERPTPGQLQCTGECIVRADVALIENGNGNQKTLEISKALKDWNEDEKVDCSQTIFKAIKKLKL